MGSGKTTIGRQLAKRLEWPFLDSDHEIASRTGVTIPTIFEIEGEVGFRRREAQIIGELTQREEVVLATGGGTVLNAENRQALREHGWVVYLNVAPRLLWERTMRHERERPLLQVKDPLAQLEFLYASRDPLYRETAHFIMESGPLTLNAVTQSLLKEFHEQCVR
ncbi:MAG: shikimate kinase [Zoogloeaceae bacterium]|nr:shikimate kinase [Zoogloeaceae bacterium]